MTFLLFTLLVIIIVLLVIDKILRSGEHYKIAKTIIGPEPIYPIIGNSHLIVFLSKEKMFKYIRSLAIYYKQNCRYWMFGVLHYNIIRAEDVERILISPKHITKSLYYKFLDAFIGTGLLTSSGSKWFHRRRILTPAFHFNILQDFLGIFKEESYKMVEKLKTSEHENGTELQNVCSRFTLNTICETAMGVKLDNISSGDNYRKNIIKMGEWVVFRSVNLWIHPDIVYKLSGLSTIIGNYGRQLSSFTGSVINKRRQIFRNEIETSDGIKTNAGIDSNEDIIYFNKKKQRVMLDTLLEVELDDRGMIDEKGIQEEVATFVAAGFETTSITCTFLLFMLAHHPEWQTKVYEEIVDILGDRTENELGISDYNDMKLLNRVIKETLRLYPPIPFMGRRLNEPLQLKSGIKLPVGTQCHIHVYDLHRDPEQFPEPNKFDPDRFLPENVAKMHPFAHVPFSAGPRNCIGQKFGMLEIKTLITNILLNFHLTPITKIDDVVFMCDIILRSKYPVKIKFTPIQKKK